MQDIALYALSHASWKVSALALQARTRPPLVTNVARFPVGCVALRSTIAPATKTFAPVALRSSSRTMRG